MQALPEVLEIGPAEDRKWMKAALFQASLGEGRTAPNPTVGCVVLDRAGELVGQGYHHRAGEPHAEVMALRQAGDAAVGGTLYVTLEPCSHWGRTPPCVEAIVKAGVSRVVMARIDPDVRVSGRGIGLLHEAGVKVTWGMCAKQAGQLNEGYLKVKQMGLPFVVLKMAMTLDGKIATAAGDSRWVTSPEARSYVQTLRDRYDGVAVGIGTVLVDDPALTVRPEEAHLPAGKEARSPARIILDSQARLPLTARVLQAPGRVIVICAEGVDGERVRGLEALGAQVVRVEGVAGRVDIRAAMRCLVEHDIHSVLLEGGAEVAASALDARVVDRLIFFVAPKILGGRDAPGPVGGLSPALMSDALRTSGLVIRRFGPDIALEAGLNSV